MRALLRLLGLLRPWVWWMSLAAAIGFFTVGAGIGLMMAGGWLISAAALMPPLFSLQVYIVGVRFFGVSRAAARYAERLITHQVTFEVLTGVRVWLFRALEPQAPALLMDHASGDLLGRLVGDVEALEQIFARAVAPPMIFALVLLLVTGLFSLWDPAIGLALAGLLLLGGVVVPLLTRAITRPLGRRAVALRAELDTRLVDGLRGQAELIAFGREAEHRARTAAVSEELIGVQRAMGRVEATQAALITGLATLGAAWSLWVGIPQVQSGEWQGMSLAAVILGGLAVYEAITPLPGAVAQLDRTLGSAERVFGLADAPPPVAPGGAALGEGHALEIRGLTHRYQDGPDVLSDLSIHLAPGRRVALVGESGAGKSTLANLLLRFWEYGEGQITLGGVDLRALDPDAVRSRFAVMGQRTVLFGRTVRANLLLGRPGASQEELEDAARRAGALALIEGLPQGWDTWLSEGGGGISGGERRRLALARALLSDAPIWLLDEPLAHLDAVTAATLHQAVLDATEGRSALLITHRLIGLEPLDEVIVLHQGRVVERGSPAELLAAGGWYARMLARQRQLEAVEALG
ncbi:MAG: thiol reductant ABC exporter subunit CydC [Deltaproteobacteria bacterium]|nr:thiol reductant ABC exporter subunit CydC [Deltaproteobacteria bacterium]